MVSVEDIDCLCRYRHAAPSAPWPWMDFNQDEADVPPLSPGAHEPWARYPQSHFGNWTPDQVQRCRMLSICKDQYTCQIHKVDVFKDGIFVRPDEDTWTREIPSDPTSAKEFWDDLQSPVSALVSHHAADTSLKYSIARFEPPRPSPLHRGHYLERAADIGRDVRGL